MKTLKVLGALISYPNDTLVTALPECLAVLEREGWVDKATLVQLRSLTQWMQKQPLLDLQEAYVALFDRTPSLSLHLFEHVHGDSRERGQALVDLSNLYLQKQLTIQAAETPDYLPMFLEYLSLIDAVESRLMLGDAINVIAAISARLKLRKTPWAAVFHALERVAATRPDKQAVEAALQLASGEQPSLSDIDAAWEEQFAFGSAGPDADASCPSHGPSSQQAIQRAAHREA